MATKKRSKKVAPEKRIYVIVPQTVQITKGRAPHTETFSVRMEPGRLMAQVGHVVQSMVAHSPNEDFQSSITKIVLSVRNSRELGKVHDELASLVGVWSFEDENPPFYGTGNGVQTVVCTGPVHPSDVDSAIGHLELYR
jgi:peptidyl-tRNA hydrolase